MKRYALFGASTLCPMVFDLLRACPHLEQLPQPPSESLALFDENPTLWGKQRFGITVQPSADIDAAEFDSFIICSLNSADTIADKLINTYHVPEAKLDFSFSELCCYMRERFVLDFASRTDSQTLAGDLAECGVYKGAFAAVINRCFPSRRLWLFDTFDQPGIGACIPAVRQRLAHPGQAVFKQGLFPDTAITDTDLQTRSFLFVNLDFNLYEPTLHGLTFFYPKLVRGGVILIHDALTSPDVDAAITYFCRDTDVHAIPIGDGFSAVIMKP